MKKIKRLFAFAVSFVLLIQAVGITITEAKTKPSDILRFLNDLNLTEKIEDENVQLTDTVKRKEFAVILAKMLNGGADLESTYKTSFSDVAVDDKSSVSIEYVTERGIMDSVSEKLFCPETAVMVKDAVKSVTVMLGYKDLAESYGNGGYQKCASSIGILSGVEGGEDDFLTIKSMSNLIYNALEAPYLTAAKIEGSDLIFSSEDKTMLSEVFNIHKGDGIVNSTDVTALSGEADASSGEVRIGDEYYETGETDIAGYLGYNVIFYYYWDQKGSDKTIVSFSEYEKRNSVLLIDAEDILSWTPSKSSKSALYYEEEDKSEKRVYAAPAFDVIYNGKNFTGYELENLFPEYGSIKLIDNNGDDLYDVIFIDSYRVIVAESASDYFGWVIDMYAPKPDGWQEGDSEDYKKFDLDAENDVNEISIKKDGEEISLAGVQKWDILSVYESEDSSERMINVIVTRKSITGKVSAIDYNDGYITIDKDRYKLSKSFLNYLSENDLKILLSDSQTFYFDHRGEIAAYNQEENSSAQYGFIRTIKVDNETYERQVIFMRIWNLQEDEWKTYRLAEKFYIDDRRANDVLIENYERGYKQSLTAADTEYVNENKICAFDGGVEIKNRDIIKYKINADEEITRIYTTEENTDYSDLYNPLDNSTMLKRNANISGALVDESTSTIFYVNADTKRITVPLLPGQFENEKLYTMSISQSHAQSLSLILYDVESYMPKIVRFDSNTAKASENVGIGNSTVVVKSVDMVLNDEDEVVGKVVGLLAGEETEYTMSYDCTVSDSFKALKKGDFIRCSVGNDGYVSAVARDIDAENLSVLQGGNTTSYGSSFTDLNLIVGTVCFTDAEKNVMAVKLGGTNKLQRERIATLKMPAVTIINKSGTFEKSDASAVSVGQKVAVRARAGATQLVEIFVK